VAAIVSLPGHHGQRSASASLGVIYPTVVVIDPATLASVDILIGALTESTNCTQATDICRQVVELYDVELDFTARSGIVIDHNRSLIASPACARGPRSLGPRIFVTDRRPDNTPLSRIRDRNVLFSGFRLEGPTSDIESDDDNREAGISVDPFSLKGLLHDVEISNMEIFHWSGEGVKVEDNTDTEVRGRMTNQNVSAVHIKNNYFHHNRVITNSCVGPLHRDAQHSSERLMSFWCDADHPRTRGAQDPSLS
jgi:hypothetical protein